MQPIRQIYDDAPASIPVPEALRHQRVELILWPLEPSVVEDKSITDKPAFNIAKVDRIDIPSREERNAR